MRELASMKVRVVKGVTITRVTRLPANKYSARYMELAKKVNG